MNSLLPFSRRNATFLSKSFIERNSKGNRASSCSERLVTYSKSDRWKFKDIAEPTQHGIID